MKSGRIKGSKNKKSNLNLCKDYIDEKEKTIIDKSIRASDLFHIAISRIKPKMLMMSPYTYIGLTSKYQYVKLPIVSINDIIMAVCHRLELDKSDIMGKSRKRAYVEARFLCFTLIKDLIKKGLKAIGDSFSRHHSTVIHGIREYKLWMTLYPEFKEHYDAIYEMYKK